MNDICFVVKNRFSFGFWTMLSFIIDTKRREVHVHIKKVDSCFRLLLQIKNSSIVMFYAFSEQNSISFNFLLFSPAHNLVSIDVNHNFSVYSCNLYQISHKDVRVCLLFDFMPSMLHVPLFTARNRLLSLLLLPNHYHIC